MHTVVDDPKILLADLSVGRWGETAAGLVGSFLVARIWQAILARSVVPEEARVDFFLFLDEFQHFLGIAGPFADALAEARSLRLSLTLANQHLGQLTRGLREAVASNARSRLVFQCGAEDAAYLAREFAPLEEVALPRLERFEAAARLVVDGRTSTAFTLRTFPPPPVGSAAPAAEVRAASAGRYGRSADEVDAELRARIPGELPLEAVSGGAPRRSPMFPDKIGSSTTFTRAPRRLSRGLLDRHVLGVLASVGFGTSLRAHQGQHWSRLFPWTVDLYPGRPEMA